MTGGLNSPSPTPTLLASPVNAHMLLLFIYQCQWEYSLKAALIISAFRLQQQKKNLIRTTNSASAPVNSLFRLKSCRCPLQKQCESLRTLFCQLTNNLKQMAHSGKRKKYLFITIFNVTHYAAAAVAVLP